MPKDLFDLAIDELGGRYCELLGVPYTDDVARHWESHEARAALATLRPQLQMLGARALMNASGAVQLKTADVSAPRSFLRAAINRVSPALPHTAGEGSTSSQGGERSADLTSARSGGVAPTGSPPPLEPLSPPLPSFLRSQRSPST